MVLERGFCRALYLLNDCVFFFGGKVYFILVQFALQRDFIPRDDSKMRIKLFIEEWIVGRVGGNSSWKQRENTRI